jgi:hypothetical protein
MLMTSAALGLSMLVGCVSYTNVPEPESAPAFKSANNSQAKRVTSEALSEIIERYPMRDAQGRYSVNLPAGTTLETAEEIAGRLPEGVVIPFEGMDASIPTYHIGRIWIRASDAKVDVLYPARSFDGSAFTGNVTAWLNGGVRSWKINRVQHWAPGTIPVPPIYVPISEEALESEASDPSDAADPVQADEEPVQLPEQADAPEPDTAELVEEPETGSTDEPFREVPVDD